MNSCLSKNAQTIQNFLNNKGLTVCVVELLGSTKTVLEAAASIGCETSQIVKSLIFVTKDTKRIVLILSSGNNEVNEKRIAHHVGEAIEKADAKFIKKVLGFAVGGVPPVGHLNPIELIFADEDLLKFANVWAAAGTPHAVFNITSQDLISITKANVISIK